jgi:hypothetical protein
MKESMQRKIFELSRQAYKKNTSPFFYPQGGGAEHTDGWMCGCGRRCQLDSYKA